MTQSKPFKIVFLCTGNICRSPMAEGILRESLDPRLLANTTVLSAGMSASPGYPASDHSVTACSEIGIDISGHQARQMTPELARSADLVLGMEMHHVYAARQLAPEREAAIQLLSSYALEDPAATLGIADPIGGSLDEYRESRDDIHSFIKKALPRIESLITSGAMES